MPESPLHSSLRIAAIFFFLSALYIIASDSIMAQWSTPDSTAATGMLKGLVYVAVAATLIFVLVYRRERANEEATSLLMERTRALVALEQKQQSALLTATVVHDVRNVVGAMNLNIKALQKERELSVEAREIAEDLNELAERLLDVTERLRPGNPQPATYFEATECIGGFIEVFERSMQKRFPIVYHADGRSSQVYGSKTLFEQMLGNILINAVEASPKGSPIHVRVQTTPEGISLEVQDSGCGIPPAQLDQIWEPLYTTKAEGTGLGLSVVRQAVDSFGGSLQLISEPEAGTCIRIVLPTPDAEQASRPDAQSH